MAKYLLLCRLAALFLLIVTLCSPRLSAAEQYSDVLIVCSDSCGCLAENQKPVVCPLIDTSGFQVFRAQKLELFFDTYDLVSRMRVGSVLTGGERLGFPSEDGLACNSPVAIPFEERADAFCYEPENVSARIVSRSQLAVRQQSELPSSVLNGTNENDLTVRVAQTDGGVVINVTFVPAVIELDDDTAVGGAFASSPSMSPKNASMNGSGVAATRGDRGWYSMLMV